MSEKLPTAFSIKDYSHLLFPGYLGPRIHRYLGGPWSMHIPFAYDLIRELKPSRLVELGVFRGESYFTFCQSIAENNLSTQCSGVDTWHGDPHTGFYGPSVGDEVAAYNGQHYATFSQLIPKTFDEAKSSFADGSIDFLHIDGSHFYSDVKHDFETWLPKLTKDGIVLFHDVRIRDRDFGVWRLWEEIARPGQSFLFPFGHGLGVWRAVPAHDSDCRLIRQLFDANAEEEEAIIKHYGSVGANLGLAEKVKDLQQRYDHSTELLTRLESSSRAEIERLSGRLALTESYLSNTRSSLGILNNEFNRQRGATKKLHRLLQDVKQASTKLRNSRRWKLANPVASLRAAILSKPELLGYGHLDKILTDFANLLSKSPEIQSIEQGIADPKTKPAAEMTGVDSKWQLRAPSEPIQFMIREPIEVSIVIPAFNQPHLTRACLASIQRHQGLESMEVIVVDDASTDTTQEELEQIPGLVYLRNEQNSGFVVSCNRGAKQARGRFLVFLNNDTEVTEGWLSNLRETFELEPRAGLVGSKFVYPDGRLQEAGGVIWRDGSGWNWGRFDDPEKPEYNFLREVDYCSGASIMIPRQLFFDLGGFDLQYVPIYYEDTDLAFKVRQRGLKVLYQPLSKLIHFEGATSGTDLSTGLKKHQEINRAHFVEKWDEALKDKPANGDVAGLDALRPGQHRILIVDHYVPMPDRDSGSLRMFKIMCILHELGHRLSFIPDNLRLTPHYSDALRMRGIEVLCHPYIESIANYLKAKGHEFDIIILSRYQTAEKHVDNVRLHAPQSRVIFDTVDLHFLREQREAELVRDPNREAMAEETRTKEHRLVEKSDETWVVSECEQKILQSDWPRKSIQVVSNVVDVPGSAKPFSERRDILFIGSFPHPPNIDAVLFFVRDVFPLVLTDLPEIKFFVIGDLPPPAITALAGTSIIVTGYQPDVRRYFDSVKLSVAPLRFGAGVKGKINQSMGLGVPVVATARAVEGMCLQNGEDILIADTSAEFAGKILELYQSEQLWNRLSCNGVEKTRMLYSRETAENQLSRILRVNSPDALTANDAR